MMAVGIDAATGLTEPRHTSVDVGDGQLFTIVAGSGIEIVMLHGWTLDHRNWLPQLPLAERARLIMPDRRGFGRSTAPPDLAREWCDIDRLAGDARFILIGLSQGASVALDYARRQPARLAALVLVGAPLHDVVAHDCADDLLPRGHYAELVAAGAIGAMKSAWAAHPLVQASDNARPLRDAMLASYDGRDLLSAPSAIAIGKADIERLPMPVLAVAGDRDTRWRQRVAAFLGREAPHGRTAIIPDAGHLCNLDNPAAFNATVTDFLATALG